MSEIEILILCILSAAATIYTWKANAAKQRNPIQRAAWAFLFSLPLQVHILYPVLQAIP